MGAAFGRAGCLRQPGWAAGWLRQPPAMWRGAPHWRRQQKLVAGVEVANGRIMTRPTVFSMDVKALYPSLKAKEVAKEVSKDFPVVVSQFVRGPRRRRHVSRASAAPRRAPGTRRRTRAAQPEHARPRAPPLRAERLPHLL